MLALFSRMPLVAARFATDPYKKALRKALATNHYDAIVLDQYALVWALPDVKRFHKGTTRIVHVAHDYESDLTGLIARGFKGNPARRWRFGSITTRRWLPRRPDQSRRLGRDAYGR